MRQHSDGLSHRIKKNIAQQLYALHDLWPQVRKRRSAAARFQGLQVRVLLKAWISLSFERCVLSGRGLSDGPINYPEESCRVSMYVCVRACVRMTASVIKWACNSNHSTPTMNT
jgi:hypothetical protein